MKAFKGCINKSCSAYRKIHYKESDQFCKKCGQPLEYVCADCWTKLDDNSERFCINCKNKRKDKRDEFQDKAKKASAVVITAVVAVAKNVKQLDKAAGDIIEVGAKVVNKINK